MDVYKSRGRIETPSCKLPRISCWFVIQARLDKEDKMPSELVSDGIFYFGVRLGFLFAFPRIAAYYRWPDDGGKIGGGGNIDYNHAGR